LVIGIFAGCNASNRDETIKTITIDVTGDSFHWHFDYPGEDGLLGNADDRRSTGILYLPDNANVTLKLHSKDYLYSFSLPKFGQSGIAVPELDYTLNFSTEMPGAFKVLGDQFCGFSHDTLNVNVQVLDQKDGFYGWELTSHDAILETSPLLPA